MLPYFTGRSPLRGAPVVPVFRDVPLRREPFIPPFAERGVSRAHMARAGLPGHPAAPMGATVSRRDRFSCGSRSYEVLPGGPSRRWERCFPVIRGGPVAEAGAAPRVRGRLDASGGTAGPLVSGRAAAARGLAADPASVVRFPELTIAAAARSAARPAMETVR